MTRRGARQPGEGKVKSHQSYGHSHYGRRLRSVTPSTKPFCNRQRADDLPSAAIRAPVPHHAQFIAGDLLGARVSELAQKAAENPAVTAGRFSTLNDGENGFLAALRRETGAIWWRVKTRVRGKVSLCRLSPKPFVARKRWRKLHSRLYEGSTGARRLNKFVFRYPLDSRDLHCSRPPVRVADREERRASRSEFLVRGYFLPFPLLSRLLKRAPLQREACNRLS